MQFLGHQKRRRFFPFVTLKKLDSVIDILVLGLLNVREIPKVKGDPQPGPLEKVTT